MNEFLNSKAMVTPGVAGGIVTLIAATLSSQFGLPAKWVAIVTSLLIAVVIFFADKAGEMIARVILLVVNALIIFSVSVGANASASAAVKSKNVQVQPPYESAPQPTPTPFFHQWF